VFPRHALGEPCASGFAVPFLERLVRDLAIDEELRELPPLRLAFEWHRRRPRGSGLQVSILCIRATDCGELGRS
jgi:hypothetical protein